jgi:hypothetical protein
MTVIKQIEGKFDVDIHTFHASRRRDLYSKRNPSKMSVQYCKTHQYAYYENIN